MPGFHVQSLAALAFAAALGAAAQSSSDSLSPYAACKFADGLEIVQTDPLAAGITSREVETDDGPRRVDMEEGLRIMFAYPDTGFYANVKAERLPAAEFAALKQVLIANLDHLAHGNVVNAALHSPMNALEVHGIDREKLEGGVLGVYLLFNEPDHTATTVYLLNQEPQNRKFQTIDDYHVLRDRFLAAYTSCIHDNLTRAPSTKNDHDPPKGGAPRSPTNVPF